MGIYKRLPDEIAEVDVIIAGGGTAGCVVASRLASADAGLSILVVECGPDNYNDPGIVHPGLFFGHLAPTSKTTLFYASKPSDHLGGRAPVVPSGGVLGGGSSINMCMYSRPQRSDFDGWNTPGWTADDMLPYMNRFETYHGRGEERSHGHDGPIQVSSGSYRGLKSEDDFIAAAKAAGWSEIEDLQTMSSVNAVSRAQRYVSPEGVRQDTAHRYLHPRLQDGKHPNLHVVVESQVIRVTVESGQATGIVFRPNPRFQPSEQSDRTIRARKFVVLSCGALGTPLVLERSGIGRKDVLAKAGVPLVAEVPGVGAGFEDHQLMTYAYKTGLEKGETLNGLVFGTTNPAELIKNNDKILGYNAQDASGKFRPTPDEVAGLGEKFQQAWRTHFENIQDKPLIGMALINGMPGMPPEGVPYGEYLGISTFNLYPFSRGHVHITGPSVDDTPDFDAGFLSDPLGIDLKMHIWAYKVQREIMRRMKCYRGEVPEWNPRFSPDSAAAILDIGSPLPDDVPDIVYENEDEAALEGFIRNTLGTTWHSMGTCKMAPLSKGGVVDGSLSVHGTKSLKIADLSIPPSNVGANTNSTALAIGEKAADIIIRELGL
ncbi:hypothetical protein QQS21_000673 [Conoideocrella luteorostrata]|uniref:Glucose-methanol-choline oxidoreductase N-terminal domain-containing protein n=1 Tax=Conoideocrella luteorostrata TaxID=1105319 RepID=A0AAJ0G2L7_9HYPO|nr:hypothetical protein QQS21_000673 [Conoideocrella luteorostrata]